MPLFLVLLGIIQFGFVFNAYVTMTNAAREGARAGSVFICTPTSVGTANWTKAQCDLARNNEVRDAFLAAMNYLAKTSPNFATGTTWTQSGQAFTNGDLVVTYVVPADVTDTTARVGQQMTVRGTYHQDLIIPLIAQLLPRDTNGRLGLSSESTMVIN